MSLHVEYPVRVEARLDADMSTGEERERLWRLWGTVNPHLDGFAGTRSTTTPVIVLEPRTAERAMATGTS